MAIPAIPRIVLAITWVSVGGTATTTGVLIQNMPMPPGSRHAKDLFIAAVDGKMPQPLLARAS
jgi:hypothetical protein